MVDTQPSSAAGAATGTSSSGLPPHHVPNPSWLGPRFRNIWGEWSLLSLKEAYTWQANQPKDTNPMSVGHLSTNKKAKPEDFRRAFPVHPLNFEALTSPEAAIPGTVTALWVGHATVLASVPGATFITDPVLSERCSPFQWMGPRRVVPSPLSADDPRLSRLDFVLISHNHYDHLDVNSVQQLNRRFGASLKWYVPLGLHQWFKDEGVANVQELDWWQEAVHSTGGDGGGGHTVRVALTPAQHWSGRGLHDRLRTLWGSFVVTSTPAQLSGSSDAAAGGAAAAAAAAGSSAPSTASTRFFFTGDTGYCPAFKEIGQRYGPFDLAAIPTGAYQPRKLMTPQHIDPHEAVQIHKDLNARHSMAIHCCTFSLTDEPLDEPPELLIKAARAAGLAPNAFLTLQHGALMQVRSGELLNAPLTLPQRQGAAAQRQADEQLQQRRT